MASLTGGKDYPIRWPRRVTELFILFYVCVFLLIAAFGLIRENDWLEILFLLGSVAVPICGSAILLATVINGVLIWREARKKHLAPELAQAQRRVRVALWIGVSVAALSVSIVIWHPFGWKYSSLLAALIYFVGVPSVVGFIRRSASPQDLRKLEERRIAIEDEMQFTRENPDPRSFIP